jgi:hypothetical protein
MLGKILKSPILSQHFLCLKTDLIILIILPIIARPSPSYFTKPLACASDSAIDVVVIKALRGGEMGKGKRGERNALRAGKWEKGKIFLLFPF